MLPFHTNMLSLQMPKIAQLTGLVFYHRGYNDYFMYVHLEENYILHVNRIQTFQRISWDNYGSGILDIDSI